MQDAYNKIKKQKRSNQGFTLIEMLVTTLIMGLVTVMIASSIQAAFQVYTRSTQASEAQVLCDTLVTAVQDELRYGTSIRPVVAGDTKFTFNSRARKYGSGCSLEVDGPDANGNGTLVIHKNGTMVGGLVPDGAYNNSLRARFDEIDLATDASGNLTGLINVKIVVSDQDGHELASQEFAVKPLNGVE